MHASMDQTVMAFPMAATAKVYSAIRWWLVDHPMIATFEWSEHRTMGASLPFLATTIAAYLALTYLLNGRILPLPRPPPHLLRLFTSLHNLFLVLLSLTMAVGCSLAAITEMPSPRWIFCFPKGLTQRQGPVFFWGHVFYLSKIYEFLDTLLIILGSSKGGGNKRFSLLHVYHHAAVVAIVYGWVALPESMMTVGILTNSVVHVVMYTYYLSSSLGWRWPPRWKKAVTEFQVMQFMLTFPAAVIFIWFHFFDPAGGGRCSGAVGLAFTGAFNFSLLALFLDFHAKNYYSSSSCSAAAGKKKHMENGKKEG